MANFRILEGKALKSAINGAGKAVATFSQLQHELAYGAILHLEKHNDATYVQAVYDVMPANFKGSVRKWFLAFGKVSFDSKALTFSYAKGGKSDMEAALRVSPAEYERDSKPRAETAFDEIKTLESFIAKMEKAGASPNVLRGLAAVLNAAKTPVVTPIAKPAKVKANAAPEQVEEVAQAA